jgi:hypothetical protein
MAQVLHFGPFFWGADPGLAPGTQHSWSLGPNPGLFAEASLVATAHPEPPFDPGTPGPERRLAVTRIQSHRAPNGPFEDHFVHVFVRNVGPNPVGWYRLYISAITP